MVHLVRADRSLEKVSTYFSKPAFEDVPVVDPHNPFQMSRSYRGNGPRIHEYLQELNKETFAKYGAVTIAELPGRNTTENMVLHVGRSQKKYDMAIRL